MTIRNPYIIRVPITRLLSQGHKNNRDDELIYNVFYCELKYYNHDDVRINL